MDFSELKTEFYARGTDYLSEDGEGVARAERWLNQAYREICNLHPWPFLHAQINAVGEVSIPQVRRVIYATDATGNYLQPTTIDQLVNSDGVTDLDVTGQPDYWYLDGSILKTFPVSTQTVYVRYITRVAPLTGTDVPVFDEEYHNLIVDRAMIKAYQDSDNFEAAAALREEFNSQIQAMVEDYQVYTADLFFIEPHGTDG